MSQLPTAVTFDCWNTLLREDDWHEAHRRRVAELRHAARQTGADIDWEQASAAFDRAWKRHMDLWGRGIVSGAREVAGWAMGELGVRAEAEGFDQLALHFETSSHSSRVGAIEGALESLAALARAGIPAALICDTGLTPGRVVRGHLERLGLLSGLRAQIFSDEVGVPKPDERIFRVALTALGVPAHGAVHVGDLLRTDVAGARGVGMRSVRLRAVYDDTVSLPEADHVIDSHAELRALLGVG